jgi:hypothetical protein
MKLDHVRGIQSHGVQFLSRSEVLRIADSPFESIQFSYIRVVLNEHPKSVLDGSDHHIPETMGTWKEHAWTLHSGLGPAGRRNCDPSRQPLLKYSASRMIGT